MKKFLFLTFVILCFCSTIQFVDAKSKYSREFIRKFTHCEEFSEKKYNPAYNSTDTYEIQGYTKDGTSKCIYVETNSWDRGTFVTTCKFLPPQHDEYHEAMLNPDIKTTVRIRGMAFIDNNENAVYLKYYNNPSVCTTIKK